MPLRVLLLIPLATLALSACSVEVGDAGGKLRIEEIASGLERPTYATAAPGDPRGVYVVERAGRIVVLDGEEVRPMLFLDITNEVQSGGEQGLLSVAFHPDYERNGLLYVDFTNTDGDTRVVEYRANRGRSGVDESTARVVLAVEQPYANHNGGQLAFGPDGNLYVGMGDGGSGGDPANNAQNLSSRLGKLLRIDVDAASPRVEIVAYGLRNPWRFSFDRDGSLWVGDVGQNEFEEIDYLPSGGLGELVNFGWDVFEADAPYEKKMPNDAGRLVGPVEAYSHDEGCSVTGGYVYRGRSVPAARGRYFYGDFCAGTVWSLRVRGGKAAGIRREPFDVKSLSSFGLDADGELLLVSLGGTLYRLAG